MHFSLGRNSGATARQAKLFEFTRKRATMATSDVAVAISAKANKKTPMPVRSLRAVAIP